MLGWGVGFPWWNDVPPGQDAKFCIRIHELDPYQMKSK